MMAMNAYGKGKAPMKGYGKGMMPQGFPYPGMGPGMMPGMGPGMGPGMPPGMGPGMYPGKGMFPDQDPTGKGMPASSPSGAPPGWQGHKMPPGKGMGGKDRD